MRVRIIYRLCLALVLTLTLTACGLLSGSPNEEEDQVVGNPANLERDTITVAVLRTLDVAPLHLAIQQGYFANEGLDIELVDVPNGLVAVQGMIGGDYDMAFGSYTPFFFAEAAGAGATVGGVKLVADATTLAPNNSQVVVVENSPILSVRDLAGTRIGVVNVNTMTQLLVMSALEIADVPLGEVTWVPIPFPDTGEALVNGSIDAAFLTEPFLTQFETTYGLESIIDTDSGPVAEMPLTGYGATGNFVRDNPGTVAAFQRGIQRGTLDARDNIELVKPLVVDYAQVDAGTVEIMAFTNYVTTLDEERIQRVSDLMSHFEMLAEPLDVGTMIVRPAPLTR